MHLTQFMNTFKLASQRALKFTTIETNHETQLKIHFQLLPSIVHDISETFCVILHTKYSFVHLNDM